MLPCVSVAAQDTMVSPIGKTSGASLVTEEMPIVSETVGSPIATIDPLGPAASIVISSGARISGIVESTTVTI